MGMPTPDGANGSVMNVNGAVGVMGVYGAPGRLRRFPGVPASGYDSSELDYGRNGKYADVQALL